MAVKDAPRHRDMIVVGAACAWFRDEMVALAAEYGLDIIGCNHVYDAVPILAQRRGRFCVVVGSLGDLGKERGTFFRLAARRGARCCCLLDECDRLQPGRIQAAVQAGAALVATASQLRALLDDWPADARSDSERRRADRRLNEQFQPTEAELKVLLGQEDDE
jgi:hypothetical protein